MSATAELVEAINSNDTGRVSAVLDQHHDLVPKLNDPLPELAFGSTALFAAVHHRNREMVDLLLKSGADINVRTDWWAGSFGILDLTDREMVDYLLGRGAKLDIHAAARHGMIDEVRRLLAEDPSRARARGGDGQTPLHVAGSLAIARLLIEHGADIDARDVDHESTPAQYQVREHPEIVRELVALGCTTDLLLLTAIGDIRRVQAMLDLNPGSIRTSVDFESFPMRDHRAGGTIYQWTLGAHWNAHRVAREFGHPNILALLMERTPPVMQLVVACESGDDDRIRSLLAEHPDLMASLTHAETRKLPDAARNADWDTVQRMLDAGWPIDATGQHGGMVLHWAAWHGNVEMVRELIARGAPLEVRDRDFDSLPIGWACYASVHGWHVDRGDYAGTVEAFLDAGARLPRPLDEMPASAAVREVLKKRT